MWRALADGLVQERNETGKSGLKERVLRRAGSPPVVVRPRGHREFVEIPSSEVATVMLRLEEKNPSLHATDLHRAVLEFYAMKRMTTNIEQRLTWIESQRRQLVAADS